MCLQHVCSYFPAHLPCFPELLLKYPSWIMTAYFFSLLLLLLILFPSYNIYYIVLLTKGGDKNSGMPFPLSLMQMINLILYKIISPFINTYWVILHMNFTSSSVIIFLWEVIVFLLSPLDFIHPPALIFLCFS